MRTCLLLTALSALFFPAHLFASPFFYKNNIETSFSSRDTFTHADTLRGSVTPEREWWDVAHYDLHVGFDIQHKSISGFNTITYKVLKAAKRMQIDLMEPLQVDSMVQDGQILSYERDGNAFFVTLKSDQQMGSMHQISVYYHGVPREARRPPWDGGLTWVKDKNGNPWVSVTCQGIGPSIWFPNKDHQYDEPEGMDIYITAASDLVAVSNGRLKDKIDNSNQTSTWHWAVVNPINNYNIIPYIGKYVHFGEAFNGEKGKLDVDYWVLEENLEKAKAHFTSEVPKMLRCFEHWFGPYPFYADGFKLVDAPHLGMEHQSAVAYGNRYGMGYRGIDLSGSGWGLKWDFIIVHESGHEWFGNNITAKDEADMWLQEGITNYSETLYTECEFGAEAGKAYVRGIRKKIANDVPIIAAYNVNQEGSGDMYYKGGNLLHNIRQIFGDDEKFRQMLRGLNETFQYQTVTTQQIESYISQKAGRDLSKVFDQYLRDTRIPLLDCKIKKNKIRYRWKNCVKGFNMPVKVALKGQEPFWIYPETKWKTVQAAVNKGSEINVDDNFYVNFVKEK